MKKICVMTAFILAGAVGLASAGPIGPVYPAPGGNSFSNTGNAADPGGAVRHYGGFDPSAWSELYFGFTDVEGPLADNTSQPLAFSGFDGTSFIWTSSANWTFTADTISGPVTESTPVEFKASFWDASNTTSIDSAVVPGGSVGIPSEPIVLAMDAATLAGWGGGYTIRASFTTTGGTPIDTYYGSFSTPCSATSSTCVNSGTNGGFFSIAPTAVPEPASLLLLGTGLLGVGRNVRRRVLARR